jgi:hypothetical protein
MSKEEKKVHNQYKNQQILKRKKDMIAEMSKELGEPIKPYTVANILSPDGKTIDVYMFEGHHLRAPWKKFAIDDNYLGSYEVGE